MNKPVKIIILAGGSGTRLWPYSTERLPKQFLSLGGKESSFLQSVKRALAVTSPENIFISSNQANASHVRRQLRNTSVDRHHILIKSGNYDTGLSVLMSLRELKKRSLVSDDECVVILPSDHHIDSVTSFTGAIERAAAVSSKDSVIVAFGKEPKSPEASFGYMVCEPGSSDDFRKVLNFVEKPEREKAQALIDEGNVLWNLGMYVAPASVLFDEFERYLGIQHVDTVPEEVIFHAAADVPFDIMVSETSERLVALVVDFEWLDIGSWKALYELLEKDSHKNAPAADTVLVNTTTSLFLGGGKPVVGIHLDDLLVIDHRDALLVVPKKHVDAVKKALPLLKEKHPNLVRGLPFVSVCTVARPASIQEPHLPLADIFAQKYPFVEHVIVTDHTNREKWDKYAESLESSSPAKAGEKIVSIVSSHADSFHPRLNEAIEESTGDIIAILDEGDTFADPGVLEKVVEVIERENADVAWGDLVYMPDTGDHIARFWRSSAYKPGMFKKGWMPPHAAFFVRRSVYEKHGLFRTDLPRAASYELMLRLLEKGRVRGVYIPMVLVKRSQKPEAFLPRAMRAIQANIESYRAWRINGLKIAPWSLLQKPLLKFRQLFARSRPIDL